MLTRTQFREYLRTALNQLYDPDRLCKSPRRICLAWPIDSTPTRPCSGS